MIFETCLAMIIAYLFGSISSAIVTCKLMNLPDPRKEGSRNPGATNVLRIGGKKAALITLIGDILKGAIPVFVAKWYGLNSTTLSLVALAAFIGHLYPIFFGFRGGKGVATAFGCLLALSWLLGIALTLTWLSMAVLFRYSSLSSLTASILAPLFTWFLVGPQYVVVVSCMSVLLIYRHRNNIRKLLAGQESKLGKKS